VMDPTWSAADEQFRAEVRAWLHDNLRAIDISHFDGPASLAGLHEWERRLRAAQYNAVSWPSQFGGQAYDHLRAMIFGEEYFSANAPRRLNFPALGLLGPTLMAVGTPAQQARWLEPLLEGRIRSCFAMTEPAVASSDATNIETRIERRGDRYVINGQKVWISRIQHSDLMILLARTTPLADVKRKSEGMSIFIVDLKQAIGNGMTVKPIRNMVNHETNEVFFDNLEIPAENLIGEEGKGFKYILDGLNAERVLIAAECIGDGYWFIDRARKYANERVVFGRPIGQNQGVQFPIADAFIELEAANLMRWKACEKIDALQNAGAEANMAKYLAAKASWEAANVCLQTHGGFGFACEYDIERKFRETRLYQVAPVSTNMIFSYVAEHILGLPRSF